MSGRNQCPQLQAAGNIYPSTFVQYGVAADRTCIQAVANGTADFVSQIGTRDWTSAYAAIALDDIALFGMGDMAPILLGGTVAAGDPLKSATATITNPVYSAVSITGVAVTATGVGTDVVCAKAQASGVAGDIILCQLVTPHYLLTGEI